MIKGFIEVTEVESMNAFEHGATVDCRIDDARAAKPEIETGFFSIPMVKDIITGADVWDIGGAAGIDFFRSGKISKTWTVLELANTWYEYSRAMAEPSLHFKMCCEDLGALERGGKQVLYAAGSLQYNERPLLFLKTNKQYCNYVILKEVPTANKTGIACQVCVGMSKFLKRQDIISAMDGFDLINDVGPDSVYPYEHHVPDGVELYNTKNFIFKRK